MTRESRPSGGPEANPDPRKPVRRRASPRRTDEIRRLLLEAARAQFCEHGYRGTATRRVASEAGVNEALLFRHFGSKQALFQQAIVRPLQEEFVALVDHWNSVAFGSAPHDPMATMMPYVKTLSHFVETNRAMLMATLTVEEYEDISGTDGEAMFGSVFEGLAKGTQAEAAAHGWQYFDPYLAPRLVFALVVAMRLFEKWILPAKDGRPSQRYINLEISEFLIHGLGHRPPESQPPPGSYADAPTSGATTPG